MHSDDDEGDDKSWSDILLDMLDSFLDFLLSLLDDDDDDKSEV